MKINEVNRIGQVNPYKNNQHTKTPNESGKKARDEVVISNEAKELLELQKTAKTKLHTTQQRIDELKDAVSTGSYHVDSSKIAEKLLPYLK
jgi:negative regulator of flagellin synthesis FlgM